MHSTEGRRSTVLVAVIGLTMLALVYISEQRSLAGQRDVPTRQEAEAAIVRTGVSSKMEAALGDAFGGVWFDPSTVRMHVGVTSPASRRIAEAVAARAGVAELVSETPVNSTWAELDAAQERWGHRLADLFERGEVMTSLAPGRNALEVELASGVSPARRAALEQQASSEGIDVSIDLSPYRDLGIEPTMRCREFAAEKAFCDPPPAGGTRIEHPGGRSCTAGPTAILKDPPTGKAATDTYLLTAGHCLDFGMGKGIGEKWFGYNTKGEPIEIGKTVEWVNLKTDIGAIKIEHADWLNKGDTPVNPSTAQWKKGEESEPAAVTGQAPKPMKGMKTCMSGQMSGTVCAEILAVGVSRELDGVVVEDLVEADMTSIKGDSGGSFVTEVNRGTVEGTLVGDAKETKKSVYHLLEVSLAKLTPKLELLTTANQKRKHPVVTAEKYPVTFAAEETSETAEHQFTAFETAVKCTKNKFHGELTKTQQEATPTVVELTPTYEGCTALGLSTTLTGNGCKYKLTLTGEPTEGSYSANGDIVCPAGKAIQFDVSAFCTVTLPPQSGLKVPNLSNSGNHIVMSAGAIEKVKVQKTGLCGTSETTTGVYDVNKAVTVSGTSGGGATKIDIGGE